MSSDTLAAEIAHLERLRRLLDGDSILPVRFDLQRRDLAGRKLDISIRGIRSLIANPGTASDCVRATFDLTMEVPPGYADWAIPDIRFRQPIPFHPHIYTHGAICWGTANTPQPHLWLADWLRGVIEYLQFNQDPGSMFVINRRSPANPSALDWWERNSRYLSRYIPPMDMGRLRLWIDRSRG